jgi:hypothetical protein
LLQFLNNILPQSIAKLVAKKRKDFVKAFWDFIQISKIKFNAI